MSTYRKERESNGRYMPYNGCLAREYNNGYLRGSQSFSSVGGGSNLAAFGLVALAAFSFGILLFSYLMKEDNIFNKIKKWFD